MKYELQSNLLLFKKTRLKMASVKCQPFLSGFYVLTRWGRVTHRCVSNLNIFGSDNGLSPDRRQAEPSHYLNQRWNIVNLNLRNKLQWNLKWNSYIFIQDNAFENVVCDMAAILSRSQCVKDFWNQGVQGKLHVRNKQVECGCSGQWSIGHGLKRPLLLTWIKFNPSMDT